MKNLKLFFGFVLLSQIGRLHKTGELQPWVASLLVIYEVMYITFQQKAQTRKWLLLYF